MSIDDYSSVLSFHELVPREWTQLARCSALAIYIPQNHQTILNPKQVNNIMTMHLSHQVSMEWNCIQRVWGHMAVLYPVTLLKPHCYADNPKI